MSKLQLLKILFPTAFGYPRAAFQLSEVQEMIKDVKELKIKNKKVTVTFDVSADIDGQNFNLDEYIKKRDSAIDLTKIKYKDLYWTED